MILAATRLAAGSGTGKRITAAALAGELQFGFESDASFMKAKEALEKGHSKARSDAAHCSTAAPQSSAVRQWRGSGGKWGVGCDATAATAP